MPPLPTAALIRRSLLRYGIVLVCSVIATLLTAVSLPFIDQGRFVFFTAAVVMSAWYGGLLPGLLQAAIAVLLVDYLFINPGYFLTSPADIIQFSLFAVTAGLISWIEESRRHVMMEAETERRRVTLILNTIADGVSVQDPDGRITYANDAAAQLVGLQTGDEMIGKTAAEMRREFVMYTEDGQRLEPSATPRARVFAEARRTEMRLRLAFENGQPDRWLHLKSAPLLDEAGEVQAAVNVFADITERYAHQQQLEAQERHLRRVLNSLFVFVGVMTPDGVLIEANEAALAAGGITPQDVLNKPFEEAYWWSYSPQVQAQLRDAIERARQGENVRYDVPVRMAGGRMMTIDFMLSPMCSEDGTVEYLIPSGVDLTQRIEIERERARLFALLDEQRVRLNNIIANIPAIIWEGHGLPDGGQAIDFVSAYAEKMLGYTTAEWREMPNFWRQITHPDDYEQAMQEAQDVFHQRRTGSVQFRCVTRDGKAIPVEAYSSVVLDERTGTSRVFGVLMDISQRKSAEDAIARYAAALRRSNLELQQFAYVASHDLQEPLRTIASYLQLLETRYKDKLDKDAQDFIYYAVDGATRMKKLINDLLVYSRVDRADEPHKPTPLTTVLDRVVSQLQVTIADNNATITHDPLPTLTVDENQMVQLLQNLIGNAIKYKGDHPPHIHIGARRDKTEWIITVRDNGIGIEPQYLERIFIIFQRLHSVRQYPGTGIGLAICKKIVERHNGRIWAESVPGEGTTIAFALPAD